ncbi:MAG: RNA-binding protein [Caulobacteraceae bacterium]
MDKKYALLDNYKDYEDRVLVNELLEYAEACGRSYSLKSTDFLDPRQQKIADTILSKCDGIGFEFYGGTENSERCICMVFSEDYELDDDNLPISILLINWNADKKKLTHRDFLGSILGSGIKREKIGDIILDDGKAYAVCLSDISQYLLYNLNKVGNTPVTVSIAEELQQKEEKLKTITTTVASLRLDSVISSGFGISRAKAVDAIKGGKVKLNWEFVESPSKEVKESDVISLRGRGRIILEGVAGTTKKDREKIVIKKYL